MRAFVAAAAVAAASTGGAVAGGIDRSGQGLGNLFESGRQIELSFGHVMPKVSGRDVAAQPTGDVATDYWQLGLSYKYDINDRISFAFIIDQPFGADVVYAPTSPVLGNTRAVAKSTAMTGILRYKMENGFSVHGGIRAQRASAQIDLRGGAYAGLNGYSVTLANDFAPGYLVGVAYERPDIALRVALTYNSEIKHSFATTETLNDAPIAPITQTDVRTPQSVNLDFQSGVAPGTLVFGQIRWVEWSKFKLSPAGFVGATVPGNSLINLDDTITYTLGVGRRFNETWAGSFSMQYEKKGNPLVSPLAPTNGRLGATLAAVYTQGNMKVTTGLNYTKVGNAQPYTGAQVPANARATMSGNKSVGIGVRVAFTF
ncbi:MAG TPA: outer membrane protein transport protein [Paracoccaceae bacterium]|nr:outer membrane protein transport protein [Paracoccaceae bacterium]HMO70222.1 outer membrane protein transport protein [Paracoccaceae bacterium]